MGKKKKGFNWKAREQPGGKLDADAIDRLNKNVVINSRDTENCNGSNALVLPSKKLKLKKETELQPVGKILSRKQRKRLEKIVDVKKKKAGRSELLEALSKVQVDSSVLARLESLSSAQTKGVKRQLVEEEHVVKMMQMEGKQIHEIDDIKRATRKRRKCEAEDKKKVPTGENVLGFDSSDSESSEDEVEDTSSDAKDQLDEKPAPTEKEGQEDSKEADGQGGEHLHEVKKVSEDVVIGKEKVPQEKKEKETKTASTPSEKKSASSARSFKPVSSVIFVPVTRDPDIIASRNKLPIIGEEQQIMDCINKNQVIILSGETGSGKTTQVPQFLYEAGYATEGKMIGVTEPRRVAATAMSARVAVELNLPPSEVSYQIRFEGNVSKDTKIKFMTDGVLLREIEKDFLLSKYSVIILDEAHERSVFTDILVGLLSRIVPLRHKKNSPLKLIIMSATLRVEDFTKNERLFKSVPPVISVESRQFPVTVHFNKHTAEDYLAETYKKVCKIHRQLPEGGILVFLTGQMEVNQLVRKLKQTFPGGSEDSTETSTTTVSNNKKSAKKKKKEEKETKIKIDDLPEINLDNYRIEPPDQMECEGDLSEDEDIEDGDLDLAAEEGSQPLHVLPLYSLLSQERQNRIFAPPPAGSRLCVVATNIAETSLTIPGVKYVVDSGKVKTKFYDKVTGVSTFVVTWTSQAAANQRAGRAGRQGPGHAYRLYSSAVFNNDMKDFVSPEIQEKPADGLLLQMKAMNIDKVVNFPFPSPPDKVQLRGAEDRLQMLRLLTAPAPGLPLREVERIKFTSTVTSLGKVVASFPVAPRFGKILALSHQHNLLPLAVALVSTLSVQEVLVEKAIGNEGEAVVPKKIMDIRRDWVGQGCTMSLGDPMVLLCALSTAEKCSDTDEFCSSVGLRPKALKEIRRLRRQLCTEIEAIMPGVEHLLQPGLAPPTQDEARMLQQLLLAGCGDQVARRIKEGEQGFQKGAYRIGAMQQPVFIHSSSVLKKKRPEWLIYQEVFEASDKVYLRGITEIRPEWLPRYTPGWCNLGTALEDPEPRYCTQTGTIRATFKGTFGPGSFPLPAVEVEYPASIEKFKYFARSILEGVVSNDLKDFVSSLLSNPIIMTKSWSNLQPRTEIIFKTLAAAKVDSGRLLKKKWESDPQFLLKAYLVWLPEVLKEDVTKIWPPNIEL